MDIKPVIEFADFEKIDLRVGIILSVSPHPDPKVTKLLVLQVGFGELGVRTICPGIAETHKAEELVGRQIVVVINLAPRIMRKVESQGMLLAAHGNHGEPLLVSVPELAHNGSVVS